MQHTIRINYIMAIALLFIITKGYSQQSLAVRQVDKNTIARQATDKEKVITYLQQRSKNGVVSIYEFNAAALQDSVFFLNIFPGESIKVVRQKMVKREGNNFSLHGYITGADNAFGSVAMVYYNGELSGNINFKSRNYSMNPLGKGQFSLFEIDAKKYPEHEDAPGIKDTYKENFSAAASPGSVGLAATACNLRVLVAITPSAETYIKGSLGFSSLTQFALQAVAETNQAYINSAVNVQMELAASVRVSYTESGDFTTDLTRFRNTADGYMDEIHTYRNLYAADVNALIINNSSACGLASTIMAVASTAFCAVYYDCALGYYSFAHEIGHLQGCRHNPEVDGTTTPYAYGHGYLYIAGGWRTVMAYDYSGQTRLQYFSNPNVTYGGVPMGTTATHHNARVINETAATVNAFRTASATATIGSSGAVINDEDADAIATSDIVLQDGFEASGGSAFSARIISCVGNSLVADNEAAAPDIDQQADEALALAIYPTLTSGAVNINMGTSAAKNAQVLVTDNAGRVVARVDNTMGRNLVPLNLAQFANGVYFVQVKREGKVYTGKVIVRH
jgi:hypothetical protein